MSFDGSAEAEWIMSPVTGIGALYGGRVWESGVPAGFELPVGTNNLIAPYITVHFGIPIPIAGTQTIAGGVRTGEHIFGFTVHVHASTIDDIKAGTRAVLRKLVGMEPSGSGNAGEIVTSGGHTLDTEDHSGESARYMRMIHFMVPIGLSGEEPGDEDFLVISGGEP